MFGQNGARTMQIDPRDLIRAQTALNTLARDGKQRGARATCNTSAANTSAANTSAAREPLARWSGLDAHPLQLQGGVRRATAAASSSARRAAAAHRAASDIGDSANRLTTCSRSCPRRGLEEAGGATGRDVCPQQAMPQRLPSHALPRQHLRGLVAFLAAWRHGAVRDTPEAEFSKATPEQGHAPARVKPMTSIGTSRTRGMFIILLGPERSSQHIVALPGRKIKRDPRRPKSSQRVARAGTRHGTMVRELGSPRGNRRAVIAFPNVRSN